MKKSIFILFFLLSLSIFLPYVTTYKVELENTEKLEEYFEQYPSSSSEEEFSSIPADSYIGVLEIPKISLKRGFYSYDSKENTVESNIEVIHTRCVPLNPCSFILASHSGTSSISYFKHLDQLELGDEATLYYQNKSYLFVLKQILHQEKKGSISLSKPLQFELVLTTCNKTQDNIQDIYIFQKK